MGHVPPGAVPEERTGAHLPRRERRRGRASRVRAARHRLRLGAFGEGVAASFLRRRGATLLASNLRAGGGEIDLLVSLDGVVVAVEVKTRIGEEPDTHLTSEKMRRMVDAAHGLAPRPGRIDAVLVRIGSDGAGIRWLRGVA